MALESVSFTLEPGVVTGLAGRNGSGKSTLMRVLAGVQRPTQGRIEVQGEDLYGRESAGHGIGAWIDGYALWPSWTVSRTLAYLSHLAGAQPSEIHAAVSLSGSEQLLGRRVGSLSLGNRQRVALAAALIPGKDFLLLDEPMTGLDREGRILARSLVQKMAAQGRSVLISSHDLLDLQSLCTDLVLLDAGRVGFSGSLRDFSRGHTRTVLEIEDGALAAAARVLAVADIPHGLDDVGIAVASRDKDRTEKVLRAAHLPPIRVTLRPATLEEVLDEHR